MAICAPFMHRRCSCVRNCTQTQTPVRKKLKKLAPGSSTKSKNRPLPKEKCSPRSSKGKTLAPRQKRSVGSKAKLQPTPENTVRLVHGVEDLVWLSMKIGLPPEMICKIYRVLCRGIFTVCIPGWPRRKTLPTEKMLKIAKRKVLNFYNREQKLGERSAVYHAFMLASQEEELTFDWDIAKERVRGATYDRKQKVDKWEDCLAMSHGDSQGEVEIGVCGHKPMTLKALTALICHEGLHNMARRKRPGQKYLSAEIEHVAMALMGDPQL